jgi:glycosyltransferase involved in cell wall biosynthesis
MFKYENIKKLAMKSGIKENKTVLIPHWMDIPKIREKIKNSNLRIKDKNDNDKILVHVGRLIPIKGVFELLRAFKLLIKKFENVKLIFVGDGKLRNDLEDFCKKNQIRDKVIFAGSVDPEEVFRYLSIADCTISCQQLGENYSWTLLEYMSAKKPIVATKVGGTTEILKDGYNSLLAEPTSESINLKIQQILKNPDFANKLARNALLSVKKKHGFENLIKYEELIKGIVK